MTRTSSPALHLICDPARCSRYPENLWVGNELVEIVTDAPRGQKLATIVDAPAWPRGYDIDGPVMLSLDIVAESLRQNASQFVGQQRVPLQPMDMHADIVVARERVAAGDVGRPRMVDVTIPIGTPVGGDWDSDHVTACSVLEALVFGIRTAELAVGATVENSRWVRSVPPVLVVLHTLEGDVPVSTPLFRPPPRRRLGTGPLSKARAGDWRFGSRSLREQWESGDSEHRATPSPRSTKPSLTSKPLTAQAAAGR